MNASSQRPARIWLSLLAALAFGTTAAQSTTTKEAGAPAPKQETAAKATEVKDLDTGDSIIYLGRKLWFEMRKRLNLTDTAEEEARKQEDAQVRLKVGGVKVDTGR